MPGKERQIDVVDQSVFIKIALTIVELPMTREQRQVDVVHETIIVHVADQAAVYDGISHQVVAKMKRDPFIRRAINPHV